MDIYIYIYIYIYIWVVSKTLGYTFGRFSAALAPGLCFGCVFTVKVTAQKTSIPLTWDVSKWTEVILSVDEKLRIKSPVSCFCFQLEDCLFENYKNKWKRKQKKTQENKLKKQKRKRERKRFSARTNKVKKRKSYQVPRLYS